MASSRRPWKIAQAVESFSKLCGNKVSSPSQVVCEMKSGKASSWIADGSGVDGCLALFAYLLDFIESLVLEMNVVKD